MQPAANPTNFAAPGSEIGGYEIVRELTPDQSWLAAAGERAVVLKSLDEDCLWKGQLHPSVKDRLGRVRELAHAGVANLYGVERGDGLTYLVWEFVQGETLDEFARSSKCSGRQLLLMARELVLSIEMLHARGIVHGAIKGANVIVNAEGKVVLTHVSPLLYTEPNDDVQCVLVLLNELLESRGETASPLGQFLARLGGDEITPRRLAVGMGALIEARDGDGIDAERGAGPRVRRRALLGAVATAALGLAAFAGMRQYFGEHAPRPPVPPQAGPAALHDTTQPGENPSASAAGFRRAAGQ